MVSGKNSPYTCGHSEELLLTYSLIKKIYINGVSANLRARNCSRNPQQPPGGSMQPWLRNAAIVFQRINKYCVGTDFEISFTGACNQKIMVTQNNTALTITTFRPLSHENCSSQRNPEVQCGS